VVATRSIADYAFVSEGVQGANGTFYLAVPPARLELDIELVAVKVISGVTQDDAVRRGARELRAFAAVDSPHLIRLYDAGQDGPSLYYSMEYSPLGSLAQPARPLERAEVIEAVADAAEAAHALHEAGIAHRNIQPSTVMLHEEGAKLADLGLAQTLVPGQTATGIASIEYIEFLDPASLGGESPSRATDIWSLGATLHRALTGVGLYGVVPTTEPLLAVRRVLSSTPVVLEELDDEDRQIIERSINPDLTERYGTAQELATDLRARARRIRRD